MYDKTTKNSEGKAIDENNASETLSYQYYKLDN